MPDSSLDKKAEALYRGTAALRDFANDRVVPMLEGLLQKTDHEHAIIGTYSRMHLWMLDLGKLNYPVHFQGVLNATRGLFELLVDLKLLAADKSLAGKYHDFAFVARFSAAKKFIDHLDADPSYTVPATPEKRRVFITNAANQTRFDDLRRKHWGTNKKGNPITPDHWSGLDLASRVTRVSSFEERRYRDIYSQCSWYVHSGSAGIGGISPDGVLAAFGWGHSKVQEMFWEGTEVLGQGLHLFIANPNLREQLELAKVATGIYFDPEASALTE